MPQLRATPLSALGEPAGLHPARYAGGADLAFARVLLHASLSSEPALPAFSRLRARVEAAAAAALAAALASEDAAADIVRARLPASLAAARLGETTLEIAIAIVEPPPGGNVVSLFHHGWLLQPGGEELAFDAYPLVGAFGARGCVGAEPGSGAFGNSRSAPFADDAAALHLAPFDMHLHDGGAIGSDVAHARVAAGAHAAGCCWVVCVDLRRGAAAAPSPRALATLLVVVRNEADVSGVAAAAARFGLGVGDSGGGGAGADAEAVLAALAAIVPALAPMLEGCASVLRDEV